MRRKLLFYGLGGALLLPALGLVDSVSQIFSSLSGATFYFYPQLRSDPRQFSLAIGRVKNVFFGGISMASVYLFYVKQTNPSYFQRNLNISQKHEKAAEILKDSFMLNAGLYIKCGQVIASVAMDVIVPEEYRRQFEQFCIQCPMTPFEEIEKLIKKETGKNIDEMFKCFNRDPISSASIAQVHYAQLHDGREVAVKIQHPWLRQQCEGDIRLLEKAIDIGERIFPNFRYRWLGEELRMNIPKELDFPLEISNMKAAKKMLKELKNVKVPDVYQEYSTESIIVMEYIQGTSLVHFETLKKEKYNFAEIAHTISQVFSRLLFKYGFVHSDPHQVELISSYLKGNIMLRKVNGQQQIVLLDHGLYTQLDDELRFNYALLWKAILEQDEKNMEKAAIALGASNDYRFFASMVTSKPFDYIMNKNIKNSKARLGKPESQEEQDLIMSLAIQNYPRITLMLNQVNRQLIRLQLLIQKTDHAVQNK